MHAMRLLCNSNEISDLILDNVVEHEGEGIILRKLGSIYEHGRSTSLVKIKVVPSYDIYFILFVISF